MAQESQSDTRLIVFAATMVSVFSFIYFFRSGQILLYGDAVAHINIARRLFDSQTPGVLQLGTVWLPLPHLITAPFIVGDWAWQSGAGASLPSMAAFVLGAVGMYRLAALIASRTAAWIAALAFVGNPNLLYMQSTAMTECIALAAMIWATVYLVRFAQSLDIDAEYAGSQLRNCALALAAGMLTRYDGWFYAACLGLVVVALWWRAAAESRRLTRRALIDFLLLCALTPALWMAFNYEVYDNPLEFLNGPYSARAIAARTTRPGDPPHPGYHSVTTAAVYFQKSAKLNVADSGLDNWIGLLALAGAIYCAISAGKRLAVLLWLMLPFYALSIAYGGVPIFMPQWWPYSYYNVRYGLQLLPAIVLSCALLVDAVPNPPKWRVAAAIVVALSFAAGAYTVWHKVPVCLREARVNARTRVAFESQLARFLEMFPPDTRFLMFTGDHVGALQRADIHLKRVLNEGNWPLWDEAMNDPGKFADILVATRGDPVAACAARNRRKLQTLTIIHTEGQEPATIYRVLR